MSRLINGLRWRLAEQNQLALPITQQAAFFDDKYGIVWRETAFVDTKLTVVAELHFSMNDFSVQAENQQIQPIVQRFREIGSDAIGFIELQPAAYLVARRVRAENDQFVPGKSRQPGQRYFALLPVTDFLLDCPAYLSTAQVAIDVAATGKCNDAQGTRNEMAVRPLGRNRMWRYQANFTRERAARPES